MWRCLIAAFLALHGLVHVIGFAATWQLGAMSGVTAAASFPTLDVGGTPVLALGALWLVAGGAFVLGGADLVAGRAWWVPVTGAAALLSLVLTVMWWQSGPAGIAIDVVVLAFLLLASRGWIAVTPKREASA